MKIIVNIEAGAEHCADKCRGLRTFTQWWCKIFGVELEPSYPDDPMKESEGPLIRAPACLAAEQKLTALVEAAGDIEGLAEQAMHDANNDGGEYRVEEELADLRQALAAIKEPRDEAK